MKVGPFPDLSYEAEMPGSPLGNSTLARQKNKKLQNISQRCLKWRGAKTVEKARVRPATIKKKSAKTAVKVRKKVQGESKS